MDVWLTDNFIILSMPCLPCRVFLVWCWYNTKLFRVQGSFQFPRFLIFFLSSGKVPVSRDFWYFCESYGGTKNIASYLNMNRLTIWNKKGPVTICSTLRQERNCNNIFALLWLSPCKPEQIIHREIYENMYIYICMFDYYFLHDLLESLHYCKQGDVYNRYS